MSSDRAFWATRALSYDNLDWATKDGYSRSFLEAAEWKPDDEVLDVGTGTGIVAFSISPYIRRVVAIDTSPEMLARAAMKAQNGEQLLVADVRALPFASESFSKVTARMVFHHIVEGTQEAASECFRVLSRGGLILLSEGVPPDVCVRDWYTDMFRLKEQRLTFMPDDLLGLIRNAGFQNVRIHTHVSKRCSVRNWLMNSGLPPSTQEQIIIMHHDLHEEGKRAYSMVEQDDDIYIDMKFLTVVGMKPVHA